MTKGTQRIKVFRGKINLFVSLILLTITVSCSREKQTKYFEGKLEYRQMYESEKLNTDSLLANSSSGAVYLINERYYKGFNFTKDTTEFILDGTTGKSLHKTRYNRGYTCFDNTENNLEPATVRHIDKEEIINGFRCKSFEVLNPNGKSIFYYSLDHKISPTVYEKHNRWNWRQTMEAANGGVTVKSIHLYPIYNLIIVLTSLEEFEVEEKEFTVQSNQIEFGC